MCNYDADTAIPNNMQLFEVYDAEDFELQDVLLGLQKRVYGPDADTAEYALENALPRLAFDLPNPCNTNSSPDMLSHV
jgi:hypothetical protein